MTDTRRAKPSGGANMDAAPASTRWDTGLDKLNDALIAIRRVLRATDSHAKALGRATNLTTSQLLVLQSIADSGEMTVGEIAAEVKLAQASVTTIVDRLQQDGLVRRTRGDTDKRKVYVSVTEEGFALLKRAPMALHDQFSARFATLEDWEQTMIVAVLQRVANMMGAEKIDAAPLLDAELINQQEETDRRRH
ncbi:MarR family winged helix-turn-helix transcriptional regulator [Marivibrio halodurans]|uniref:MarR family winged helix-turn-helix transcriptional regulator n=1 Tax=Marivibrio halodurans TaxID=2039722 RepID=UPI001FE36279|nr:MarR family transcriptional regulator [Marivibrio halodurans]